MLHVKFCKIPCNKRQDTTITRILKKTGIVISLLRYIHVNVSLFLIIYILHINFCAILFNRSRDTTILEKQIAAPFSKPYPCTIIRSMSSLNICILRIKFYKISCNGSRDKIIRILEKTKQQLPLKSYTHLNCIVISNNTHLAQKFCTVSFIRNQDMRYLKISGKIVTTAPSRKLCSQNLYNCYLLM